MKFKTFLFFGLCAFGLCTEKVQAMTLETVPITYYVIDNLPAGYEEIHLMGELLMGTGPNSIIAGANDDAVYIGFNQSFGNVNIKIYNGYNALVYNTVVNTDLQHVFIIPFSNVASGNYTVELSNANGYVEGDFNKD